MIIICQVSDYNNSQGKIRGGDIDYRHHRMAVNHKCWFFLLLLYSRNLGFMQQLKHVQLGVLIVCALYIGSSPWGAAKLSHPAEQELPASPPSLGALWYHHWK